MTKAVDAIGLAALRSPGPVRELPRSPSRPPAGKRARRRLKLRFGRMMFAGVVIYLIGAGAVGELQLLKVQEATHVVTTQLSQVQRHNQSLQRQVNYLRSKAGQEAAVRSQLHYAPGGTTPIIVKTSP